jgi:hypothetical protein
MTEQAATQSASGARPTLITILCILSFIGGGLGILGGLAASVLTGLAGSLASIPGLSAATAGGFTYGIITLVLSAVSLFGAIKIWGMKKMGVYLYAGAQVLMLITPWIFMGEYQSVAGAAFGWVITIAFIAAYWSQMKNMS